MRHDVGDKVFGIAMILWIVAFVTFILSVMVPIIPIQIGGPIFLFGLCSGPLLIAGLTVYEIFCR